MAKLSKPRRLLLTSAVLAVAACQSAPPRPLYQPLESDTGFGYTERQIDDTHWEVTYAGPRYSAPHGDEASEREADLAGVQAYDLALWRAAEIALEQERQSFAVVSERRDFDRSTRVDRRYSPFPYYPFGFRHPGYWGYRPWYFDDYSVRSSGEARVKLTIDLEPDPGSQSFDAKETAERLESEYAFKTWPPQ
ncbi:MAG TPA: hypothetical protein VED46_14655 [Alphaproteobacteria bacterium]|nr:hypothetical protein [Alphaproteobacteria bacterium]